MRGFSIRNVFFGTTMTLSMPKAFLICSLLTTHLTKAAIINSLCSVGAGEWNDWNISVASGIAFSGRSEEVLWKLNNVRSTRNKISAILGHNKRRLADVKLFGTGSWDWEAIAANRGPPKLYTSSRNPECPTVVTGTSLRSGPKILSASASSTPITSTTAKL